MNDALRIANMPAERAMLAAKCEQKEINRKTARKPRCKDDGIMMDLISFVVFIGSVYATFVILCA